MESNAPHSKPETLGARGGSELQNRPAYRSAYLSALLIVYVGLICLYLTLRFNWFKHHWPKQQDVNVDVRIAAIGTVACIGSSIAIALAVGAARANRLQAARLWLLLTVLLGIGFLLFQASEYRSRWSHNLIPAPFSNCLRDRADLYFLSAVNQRLTQIATAINSDKVRQNQLAERLWNLSDERKSDQSPWRTELQGLQAAESQRSERLVIVNRLLNNESRWTASVVALADDPTLQRMAMAALAHDIHPHREFEATHQRYRQFESLDLKEKIATARDKLQAAQRSASVNSEPLKPLLTEVAASKSQQQLLSEQLKAHLRKLLADEEIEDATEQIDDPKRFASESQLADVQQRLDESTAKLTAAATLVTDAEDSATKWSHELTSLAARQTTIAEIDNFGQGLNRQYEWLRLPVCIPGGTIWTSTYYVLVSLHTIHVLIALITVMLIAARRLDGRILPMLQRASRNWHCMVIVWFTLFVLIYLI
jgi:heme/copper-type cytochrome/quinol oxidase subunit 3